MSHEIGAEGEKIVAQYLEKQGKSIIARNYRTRTGEIDIIAQHADTLEFIEVKTMLHEDMENLRFLIDGKKQEKIVQTAKQFLAENRHYEKMTLRFDVAVLKTNPFLKVRPEIVYIENAFGDTYDK